MNYSNCVSTFYFDTSLVLNKCEKNILELNKLLFSRQIIKKCNPLFFKNVSIQKIA